MDTIPCRGQTVGGIIKNMKGVLPTLSRPVGSQMSFRSKDDLFSLETVF